MSTKSRRKSTKRYVRKEREDREAAKRLKQVEKETAEPFDSERTGASALHQEKRAAQSEDALVFRVPALRQSSGTANDDGRADGRGTHNLSGSRARGR